MKTLDLRSKKEYTTWRQFLAWVGLISILWAIIAIGLDIIGVVAIQ